MPTFQPPIRQTGRITFRTIRVGSKSCHICAGVVLWETSKAEPSSSPANIVAAHLQACHMGLLAAQHLGLQKMHIVAPNESRLLQVQHSSAGPVTQQCTQHLWHTSSLSDHIHFLAGFEEAGCL